MKKISSILSSIAIFLILCESLAIGFNSPISDKLKRRKTEFLQEKDDNIKENGRIFLQTSQTQTLSSDCNINRCVSCDQTGGCIQCEIGYVATLDGLCAPCPVSNCAVCNLNGICNTCATGYNLNTHSNSCFSSSSLRPQIICHIQFCTTCGSDGNCLDCDPGYTLVSGLCAKCPDNCYECTQSQCTSCVSGYSLNSRTFHCYSSPGTINGNIICNDPFCNSCTSPDSCVTCDLGYDLMNGQCILSHRIGTSIVAGPGGVDFIDNPPSIGSNIQQQQSGVNNQYCEEYINGVCTRCVQNSILDPTTLICSPPSTISSSTTSSALPAGAFGIVSMPQIGGTSSQQNRCQVPIINGQCSQCNVNYYSYNGQCYSASELIIILETLPTAASGTVTPSSIVSPSVFPATATGASTSSIISPNSISTTSNGFNGGYSSSSIVVSPDIPATPAGIYSTTTTGQSSGSNIFQASTLTSGLSGGSNIVQAPTGTSTISQNISPMMGGMQQIYSHNAGASYMNM